MCIKLYILSPDMYQTSIFMYQELHQVVFMWQSESGLVERESCLDIHHTKKLKDSFTSLIQEVLNVGTYKTTIPVS